MMESNSAFMSIRLLTDDNRRANKDKTAGVSDELSFQVGNISVPLENANVSDHEGNSKEITELSSEEKFVTVTCLACDKPLNNSEETLFNFHCRCLRAMAETRIVSLTDFHDNRHSSLGLVAHGVRKSALLTVRLALAGLFGIVQTMMTELEEWI